MGKGISRRQFITTTAATTASIGAAAGKNAAIASAPRATTAADPHPGTWVRWLDDSAPALPQGVTWGAPWPRGKHRQVKHFALRDAAGSMTAVQSWPLAWWPDGSLKWSAHALPPVEHASALARGPLELIARRGTAFAHAIVLKETAASIEIDTGVLRCRIARDGTSLITALERAGRERLRDGQLVVLRQDGAPNETPVVTHESFVSAVDAVNVEQRGPLRAVVRIEGRHSNSSGRHWLPFTLRLYFYAGSEALRLVHTFVFDGDETRDFIRGIGLRFAVPQTDALHDRHVRFVGDGNGIFAEAVRGLTGLRRDPGEAARRAQVAGQAVPAMTPAVSKLAHLIPAFGDWTLLQGNAGSFTIRKRTRAGHAWLDSAAGRNASGLGYVGGPAGGVTFGIRNFWQSHPAQLDVRGAHEDLTSVTLWLWAPDAGPMDLRFYHDGLQQDSYEKQLQGLDITYEDYEPGFGTAKGVARTSEMMLWIENATPSRERLLALAGALRAPAVMVPTPQTLVGSGVFGRSFSLPAQTPDRHAGLEHRLDWLFDFYRTQQRQHGWYGFWNYGDVMHTYDADRHVWRYDIGGYAWDNSELSTDIWLWLYFLRGGRADAFRFAEAMTRHTGEVDVHHLGRFAPLGSRHNVMHWGCSAKQLRISTALNRRYHYYLTADERVGDLMREQNEAARTLRTIVPERKLPHAGSRPRVDPHGEHAWLGFGTDWGSIAGAWLTEWERTRAPEMRERLLAGMRSIAAQPRGFFTGGGRMNLRTGEFDIAPEDRVNVSHLSAAFGLPEVCAELIELLPVPEFERAWLQYCRLFNAPEAQQVRELGEPLGKLNLEQGHARLTAYAAYRGGDAELAERAWREFAEGRGGYSPRQEFSTRRIEPPAVLNPVDEAPGISTNATAQWGLAAIQCLAFTQRLARKTAS